LWRTLTYFEDRLEHESVKISEFKPEDIQIMNLQNKKNENMRNDT